MSQIMIIYFPPLETEVDVPQPPDHVLLPKQYFIILGVENRCQYIRTTVSEIERYMGIHMIGTIVRMPSYRMYWSEGTRYAPVVDSMSRNRFDTLRAFIHVNDNTHLPDGNDHNHDKLFKFCPFVDSVRENMKKVSPDDRVSIDEMIIPFNYGVAPVN